MKVLALTLFLLGVLIPQSAAAASKTEPDSKEHPGVVALSKDADGYWAYKSFPQLTTLYISRKDAPGVSNCDERCTTVWPPLAATEQDVKKVVGHWTVIRRSDGLPQWAYRGKPVYLRFHDMPADPHAIEVEGFLPLEP
jgi:predicted lipoprotein with Yx(FWY)xxD motif